MESTTFHVQRLRDDSKSLVEDFDIIRKNTSSSMDLIQFSGWASTEDKDAYGDVVKATAWEEGLQVFSQNPNLFYNHIPRPIGVVKSVSIVPNKGLKVNRAFIAVTKYTEDQMVHEFLNGWLRGMSPGFLVKEFNYNEEDIDEDDPYSVLYAGRIFTSVELREISVTPIPANPQALINMDEIYSTIEKGLGLPDMQEIPNILIKSIPWQGDNMKTKEFEFDVPIIATETSAKEVRPLEVMEKSVEANEEKSNDVDPLNHAGSRIALFLGINENTPKEKLLEISKSGIYPETLVSTDINHDNLTEKMTEEEAIDLMASAFVGKLEHIYQKAAWQYLRLGLELPTKDDNEHILLKDLDGVTFNNGELELILEKCFVLAMSELSTSLEAFSTIAGESTLDSETLDVAETVVTSMFGLLEKHGREDVLTKELDESVSTELTGEDLLRQLEEALD